MNEPTPEVLAGLPVMLDVTGRRCVVIGGGAVGVRRARSLAEAGARVIMIALQVHPSARLAGVNIEERAFEPDDLNGALLVVIATDVPEINDMISAAADQRGVLVNRADDASQGNLTFMTSHRDGPLTVAVHTGGASASTAVKIRDLVTENLDPDWAGLLACALVARREIQSQVQDPAKRTGLLRRLCDEQAMAAYKSGGESRLKTLYADMMKDFF